MGVVYDVSHNICKEESYVVDGKQRRLLVHRKGATRAFPPRHPDVPAAYADIGQPVLVGGSMGHSLSLPPLPLPLPPSPSRFPSTGTHPIARALPLSLVEEVYARVVCKGLGLSCMQGFRLVLYARV
jgi:hypothetical protein